MHQLRGAGQALAPAAAALGLTLQLTGRFWRARSAEQLLAARGPSALDPFKPYLRRRWAQGTTKIAALHQEITAQGYGGSYTTVHAFLTPLKLAAPPRPPAPPTPRQATALITRDPASLGDAGHHQLAAIRSRCPELRPSPATSPDSPRSSPAGTTTSSTPGSPPSTPTPASPNCTPSPPASARTAKPSATP